MVSSQLQFLGYGFIKTPRAYCIVTFGGLRESPWSPELRGFVLNDEVLDFGGNLTLLLKGLDGQCKVYHRGHPMYLSRAVISIRFISLSQKLTALWTCTVLPRSSSISAAPPQLLEGRRILLLPRGRLMQHRYKSSGGAPMPTPVKVKALATF